MSLSKKKHKIEINCCDEEKSNAAKRAKVIDEPTSIFLDIVNEQIPRDINAIITEYLGHLDVEQLKGIYNYILPGNGRPCLKTIAEMHAEFSGCLTLNTVEKMYHFIFTGTKDHPVASRTAFVAQFDYAGFKEFDGKVLIYFSHQQWASRELWKLDFYKFVDHENPTIFLDGVNGNCEFETRFSEILDKVIEDPKEIYKRDLESEYGHSDEIYDQLKERYRYDSDASDTSDHHHDDDDDDDANNDGDNLNVVAVSKQ